MAAPGGPACAAERRPHAGRPGGTRGGRSEPNPKSRAFLEQTRVPGKRDRVATENARHFLGDPLRLRRGMLSADDVIAALRLQPHPEGGFYRETFRAEALPLPLPERGERSASTAIYFLLRSQDFSALHVVASDEAWHHYCGDTLSLHCFDAAGAHREVRLGSRLLEGEHPQHVVRRGELQGARVAPGPHGFALCGCTVAPGFDFADFRMPARAELTSQLPQHAELVRALTR